MDASLLLTIMIALSAALCWSISPFLGFGAAQRMGAVLFGFIRQVFAASSLLLIVWFSGGLVTIDQHATIWLIASGLVGIFIGDGALFAGLRRLGPRRLQILWTTNAPITVVLAWMLFDERLSIQTYFGMMFVFTGTLIAIAFRERLKEETQGSRVGYWEAADGATLAGIGYALLAALGHSGAVIMLDGVMSNPSIDPFAASAIRVGAACLAFGVWCALMARGKVRSYLQNHDPQRIRQDLIAVFASASCGITLGMTFIVLALKSGSPGIVTVMASTTPIISLPILWLVAGKRPNPTAWIGAALAVCGTSLIALAPAAIG